MLGNCREKVNKNDKEWFIGKLEQYSVKPIHFEDNEFTKEYLSAYRAATESTESKMISQMQGMLAENEALLLANRHFHKIGYCGEFDDFLELCTVLGIDNCSSLARIKTALDLLRSDSDVQQSDIKGRVRGVEDSIKTLAAITFKVNGSETKDEEFKDLQETLAKLSLKHKEYKERLQGQNCTTNPSQSQTAPQLLFTETIGNLEELSIAREQEKQLDTQLHSYMNLPQDPQLAALEVERANEHLSALIRERDRLLKITLHDK